MSKQINNTFQLSFAFSLFIVGLLILNSCRNEEIYRIAKIQTDEVVNITDTSAVAFGVIIDIGEGISEYGFCWNTEGTASISDSKLTYQNANQTGKFTGIISGLKGGTSYYINTYANNGEEIIYGKERIFSCIEGLPKVITDEISNIAKASLNGKGIIIDDGGSTILAKGFIWSELENPVLGRIDGFTDEAGDSLTFTSEITNLVPNVEVYIRAYATNENGTGYGEVKMINTLQPESGDYIWANYYGSYNHELSNAICTDATGNIFITGRFKEYTTLGNYTLNAEGEYDVFIAKLNDEGEVVWAKSAGGIANDNSYDICTDDLGNIYITGSFNNSITFGAITLNSSGQEDFFLAKYDNSGNVLWAKSAGGTSADIGKAVTVDANGNAYITGSTYSTSITFGSFTLSTFTVFTVKYDHTGTVLWANGIDRTDSQDICIDNSGNVYIIGKEEIGGMVGTIIYNVFIAKFNDTGDFQWVNDPDGYGQPNGICCDNSGNIYASGHSASVTFTGQATLDDLFIAKFSSSGTVIWARSDGGTTYRNVSHGISIDDSDNIYISGSFLGDYLAFGTDTLYNSSYTDLFFAKYNSNGEVLSAKSTKGSVDDYGTGICTFGSNYIYLTGYANSRFLELDYFTIENKGRNDLIIAKIKQ